MANRKVNDTKNRPKNRPFYVHIGDRSHEKPAYQQQSDFLRAVGVIGSVDELDNKPEFSGPGNHEFFVEESKRFKRYEVSNPAIWP